MPYIFFLLISLSIAGYPLSNCLAKESSAPIPFAPLQENNSVPLEFLELFKDNPQGSAIPENILSILQNKDSLEPPTIIRQAPTVTQETTVFSKEAPITGKINSPYLPVINEITKDPTLLQNIPLNELNKLILDSTTIPHQKSNTANELSFSNFSKLPQIQPYTQPQNFSPNFFLTPTASTPTQQNQLSDLQKLQIMAVTQENIKNSTNSSTQSKPLPSPSQKQNKKDTEQKQAKNILSSNVPTTATDQALSALKIEELEEKAQKDDENAKILLARAYFNGTGGHKNIRRAFQLMEENARRGSSLAMLELGKMYEGDSPRFSIKRAAGYYKQAADYGNIEGKYQLGLLYYNGKIGHGDEALRTAIYLFREVAAKDHAPSMYQLASMYEKGVGFQKDMGQAVQLYRKSAHLGYAPSQLQVGLFYENGILLPRNETLAAGWYTKAAEQNHPMAQYLLAGMYRQGKGIPQNLAHAKNLYESAANYGLVDAQYDLGIFYMLKSEFQNYKKAEYWLQKAADQNDTQAKELLLQLQSKQLSQKNKK